MVPNFGPQSPELDRHLPRGRAHRHRPRPHRHPLAAAAGLLGAPGYPFWPGDAFAWGWNGPSYPVSDYPNLEVALR